MYSFNSAAYGVGIMLSRMSAEAYRNNRPITYILLRQASIAQTMWLDAGRKEPTILKRQRADDNCDSLWFAEWQPTLWEKQT